LKFFFKKNFKKNKIDLYNQRNWLKTKRFDFFNNLPTFKNFILKKGSALKSKVELTHVLKNINYFLYFNSEFLLKNYTPVKGLIENFLLKKMNSVYIVDSVMNIIKPPFVVKTVLIPKKLRKKTKQKYLVKIVYKNENKRLSSSYKQLYHYSNNFTDRKFKFRLYKAFMFSFLEWKNSHLFKLKGVVFKKFFKF